MKRIVLGAVGALLFCSCHQFIKPRLTVELTNKSHEAIKNVEVDYPGGSYGIPVLDVYAMDSHTREIDVKACKLTVKFEDTTGHALGGKQLDLGPTCPRKLAVVVSSEMAVSADAMPK